MGSQLSRFVQEDIWLLSDKDLSVQQRFGVNLLKVILLSIQGFKKDDCPLRASALTLYTLLSIVPVIALLFGVAKGFGFEKKLEERLLEQASEHDTMMLQVIEFSQNMLANTKGGVVAGIGIIVLFWSVIKVIGNIEESFNFIWKIHKDRPLARKLSDYLSLMMLAPVLMIASSSINVFIKTKITWLIEVIQLPEFGTKLVLFAMGFTPLLILSLLFTFIFLFMPNQKVSIKAGVIAGIVTAILYQMVQSAYLSLQIGVSSYNAIYGSFAALPLFLIWLQIGWMVVLFGCEIAFFVHNFESYRHNKKFSNLSFALKKSIAVQVLHAIISRFSNGQQAPDTVTIASELQLPVSIVQSSLSALEDCGLAVALNADDNEEVCFQPGRDINKISIASVKEALETSGQNVVPGTKSDQQITRINQYKDDHLIRDF
ncbi:MAG: YihY/virulence factor BrkB family protein [Gammaproteobacteria bacterium]|nr:YihY/virulence factor BrkB family protein [Gammaproteobacteria bacterium]